MDRPQRIQHSSRRRHRNIVIFSIHGACANYFAAKSGLSVPYPLFLPLLISIIETRCWFQSSSSYFRPPPSSLSPPPYRCCSSTLVALFHFNGLTRDTQPHTRASIRHTYVNVAHFVSRNPHKSFARLRLNYCPNKKERKRHSVVLVGGLRLSRRGGRGFGGWKRQAACVKEIRAVGQKNVAPFRRFLHGPRLFSFPLLAVPLRRYRLPLSALPHPHWLQIS